AALERCGTALGSATRLAGRHAIRLCILNPTSSAEHVRKVIEHFAGAQAPAGNSPGENPGVVAAPGPDVLGAVPLLAGLPAAARRAVQARGVYCDVAAGEEVIRRWDADRFFYIVLTGRYDVFIDTRLIRSHGPGDHFGELAARDWGGAYGRRPPRSPRATGAAATATPGSPPFAAPNRAGCCSSPPRTWRG